MNWIRQNFFLFPLFAGTLLDSTALARFDEQERSIHNTAELLPRNGAEISLNTIHFGITDYLMLSTPQVYFWGQMGRTAISTGYKLTPSLRAMAFVFHEKAITSLSTVHVNYGGGLGFGKNFGDRSQHSYAFTINRAYFPKQKYTLYDDKFYPVGEIEKSFSRHLSTFEYTYYTESENIFYVGMQWVSLYIGYTWGGEHFHWGILVSPMTGWQLRASGRTGLENPRLNEIIPIPYVYLRF